MTTPTDQSLPAIKIELNKIFILDPGSESIFYKFDGTTLFVKNALPGEKAANFMVDCDVIACRCPDEFCILRNEDFQDAIKYVDDADNFPKLSLVS